MTDTTYTTESLSEHLSDLHESDPEAAQREFDGLAETMEVADDCLVPEPERWYADDGNAEVECGDDADSAREQYVQDGDWGEDSATSWVTVYSYRKGVAADGSIEDVDRESDDVAIDPTEPDCHDGEDHDWQTPHEIVGGIEENPGCWGHGGGVYIHHVCLKCGCRMTTDSWAQNPSNGVQGLDSVEYEEDYYEDRLEELAKEAGESIGKRLAETLTEELDEYELIQGKFRESAVEHAEIAMQDARD